MTRKIESGEEERILCTQRARGSRAPVGARAVFLWLPGFGARGRIFAKLEKSFWLCGLHLYPFTHIPPMAWAVAAFKLYWCSFH